MSKAMAILALFFLATTADAQGVPNDAYGNPVTFSTDGTLDYYAVNGYPTVAVTAGAVQAIPYLKMAIQENEIISQQAFEIYTSSYFDVSTQNQFRNIYTAAQNALLINRAAYCYQLVTWGVAVAAYATSYLYSISSATNAATVAATTPNFNAISVSPPAVTIVGAMSIMN